MENNKSNNFSTSKIKTNEFFKQSKVDSCSYVLVKNGQSMAVPFKITNSKGKSLNDFKKKEDRSSETISLYRKDYTVKPYMHAGMEKKPLVPYDPLSYRNRLPTTGIVMAPKNKSIVEIGDRSMINRKQWKTTTKDAYQWPKTLPITNTGITSDLAIRAHKKLESII